MKLKILFLPLTFFFSSITLIGQINPNDYDMTCYCQARETPHSIVGYDNNLQIIIACKNGLSRKDLDSLQIPYKISQLKLLRVYNLLRLENGKYYSNIPILNNEQTRQIRIQSKEIANKIAPNIYSDVEELVEYLNSINCSQNAFSVVFSYVLDGLIWKQFKEQSIIKPIDQKDSISPWTGHFWLLSSKRNNTYGTNSETDSILTIAITNGARYDLAKSFYDEDDLIEVMLKNINQYGKVIDTSTIRHFQKLDVLDEQGNVIVPIIIEKIDNPLFSLSNQISKKVCDYTIKNSSLNEIVKQYKFQDIEEALIILYHEILWDLVDNILAKGIVDKPLIFKTPDKAEIKDLSNIIYFIKK